MACRCRASQTKAERCNSPKKICPDYALIMLAAAAQTKAERCNSPKKICGAKADLPFNDITGEEESGCSYAFKTAGACCLATTP